MENIVTRKKEPKKQYTNCQKCGTPKKTIKQKYSPLCRECCKDSYRRIVFDGKQKCTKCGEIKSLDSFYSQSDCPNGKRPECKICANKRINENHKSVPLLKKLWSKISYERNKQKTRLTAKLYRENHKEEISIRRKAYNETHKEQIKQKARAAYLKDPSKAMERLRKRKARIKGGGGVFTEKDWKEVLERYGYTCLKCGSTENIVRDHVIPIAKGGRNDKFNIQPLCHHCNSVKSAKTEDYRFDKGIW